MSTDDTYQGWTSWDTWAANLWLTNDQDAYTLALECKDEFALNDLFEETFDDPRPLSVIEEPARGWTGFIDGIDPDNVNWAEIWARLHAVASLHEGEALSEGEEER